MNIQQIKQIVQFLSAYPKDIVEEGIKAWRVEEITVIQELEVMQGKVTDVQLDKRYNDLDVDTKQFLQDQSELTAEIMPYCACGKQLNLTGVCDGCKEGKEGWKSKYICSCGYEEYFKVTVREKIAQLKEG